MGPQLRTRMLAALVLISLMAGCTAQAARDPVAQDARGKACDRPAAERAPLECGPAFPACEHPWPCADGSEWDPTLIGQTFGLREVLNISVMAPDNTTQLVGWVGMPNVTLGTRVPVLLSVTPYMGACNYRLDTVVLGTAALVTAPSHAFPAGSCIPTAGEAAWWNGTPHLTAMEGWGIAPIELVRQGYAVAFFSSRGTGPSGGCWDYPGLAQNGDEAAIIQDLANRDWSNGRVGIGGVSASAATAMLGAVTGAPALKTVLVAGTLQDGYTMSFTPQGAGFTRGLVDLPWGQTLMVSLTPPLLDPSGNTPATRFPERTCKEAIEGMTQVREALASDRNQTFWERLDLVDDLDNVTASLLVGQGFQDRVPHAFQDTYLWPNVDAPKRSLMGQWQHGFPIELHQPGRDVLVNGDQAWKDIVVAWLDFWLKGVGPVPERLDRVDFQETGGAWRSSESWPPAESKEEVLYLADKSVQAEPASISRSFRSIPVTGNEAGFAHHFSIPWSTWAALCDRSDQRATVTSLAYASKVMDETVVLAGNPFAYLTLTSDLPGGIVSVSLWEVPKGHDCNAPTTSPRISMVAFGAADLRFYQGNFIGADFPKEATQVRVDLFDTAETIEAGSRLLVVLDHGETLIPYNRLGQPFYPQVTVHGDSHLVLPFLDGTLGGKRPTIDYPPRPFMDS